MPKRMIARASSRARRSPGGRTQREVICDVMLSAAERGTWLTLRELAGFTKYGEASISAQLRHLRKPRYGAFVVEKRPRDGETSVCLAHASPRLGIPNPIAEVPAEKPQETAGQPKRSRPHGGAMGVKPEFAFDVCWEVYRGAREVLETKRGVSALDWKESAKFLWQPDIRPRLNEYVADFALAGQAALDGADWASRMVLFRLYYLGLVPYERARPFLGLSELGWSQWTEQIRRRCGKEILRRGLFPPRKYFLTESERAIAGKGG